MDTKFNLKIKDHIHTPDKKRYYNEHHFAEAAPRYDFATRAMSLWRDAAWKRNLVAALPERESPACLDLACGTGDVTFLLADKYPGGRVIGLDLTQGMLEIARERNRYEHVSFTQQDMCTTNFSDESFDIVTGGYALRNAPDIRQSLDELHRVMKPGGIAAFLDFSKPATPIFQIPQYWLLKIWCGFWGFALHRNPEVHSYIAATLKAFPHREHLRELLRERRFELISSRRFYMGIVELIVFRRPSVKVDYWPAQKNCPSLGER